jgi:hypothetical protein
VNWREVDWRAWSWLVVTTVCLAAAAAGLGAVVWELVAGLRTQEGREIVTAMFCFGWLVWRLAVIESLARENQAEVKRLRAVIDRRIERAEESERQRFLASLPARWRE